MSDICNSILKLPGSQETILCLRKKGHDKEHATIYNHKVISWIEVKT